MAMALQQQFDPPELNGYLTASQVAERLGISRQAVNKMIRQGRFRSCKRVGSVFIVRESEAEKVAAARAA